MRCFTCQEFGHSRKYCKNPLRCWKCGNEGHDGSECTSESICCVNCKGKHFSSDKSCPTWIFEKEVQRVKAEKALPYGEARRLVTASSTSSSSPIPTSYASAVRSTPKRSIECQTPAFWIGPQPSLREASKLPSVQTASTGSGTQDTTPSNELSGNKHNTRKSSPAKSSSSSRNNKNISNKHIVKDISKPVETGNKFQYLSSDVSEDMDTTQSPRPSRSKSRSRNRSKNISPIKIQ